MAVLRNNVLLWTARRARNASTGQRTALATVYLAKVPAYLKVIPQSEYKRLPVSALGAEYEARVAPGTDIRAGDRILALTRMDGVTAWPDFATLTDPQHAQSATMTSWWVKLSLERPPGPNNYRPVYLARRKAGGEELDS